jgi:alpha-mannosidase
MIHNRKFQYVSILVYFLLMNSISFAQKRRIFIGNDDHTDYMWSADEETYEKAFIKMLDYYMDVNDKTDSLPVEYQHKWNCDGTFWLWVYEQNKRPEEFQRLISQVKKGRITVAKNTLISCYGGIPFEATLRGMYYAGSLERRFNLELNMASAMENQVLPYGLSSIWAGAGVKYAWHGVCGCATRTSGLENRPHEIYWYKGPDDNKVLMKWNSLLKGDNKRLGGYAEARNTESAVEDADSICNTPQYPYDIVAAFGKGWDDIGTYYDKFPIIAEQ